MEKEKLKIALRGDDKQGYLAVPKCHNSHLACRLARTDSLNREGLKILELLGFEIEVIKETE